MLHRIILMQKHHNYIYAISKITYTREVSGFLIITSVKSKFPLTKKKNYVGLYSSGQKCQILIECNVYDV